MQHARPSVITWHVFQVFEKTCFGFWMRPCRFLGRFVVNGDVWAFWCESHISALLILRPKGITPREPNWSIQSLMLWEKKQKDALLDEVYFWRWPMIVMGWLWIIESNWVISCSQDSKQINSHNIPWWSRIDFLFGWKCLVELFLISLFPLWRNIWFETLQACQNCNKK